MKRRTALVDFLMTDAAGGFILAGCAMLALIVANSALAPDYFKILHAPLPVDLGPFSAHLDAEEWIKDGLMTIFFFVVGLELKRELVVGELSDPRAVVLPVAAALGGMIVPAALYLAFNLTGDVRGWPVPVATDIAFALAALAILGRGAPPALRIFLLTLAVVDDLGAVVLIALLYSKDLAVIPMIGLAVMLIGMAIMGRKMRVPVWVYLLGAVIVWAFALKSGIHTSVAGVAAAFTVPLGRNPEEGTLVRLEHTILPISAFVVLPLFAFASAGVPLQALTLGDLLAPVPLGIALSLALGKPVGVLVASVAVTGLRFATWPRDARSADMIAVACLCGVGFTMSLFLGALAFRGDNIVELEARLGIMAGSVLALVLSGVAFAFAKRRGGAAPEPGESESSG